MPRTRYITIRVRNQDGSEATEAIRLMADCKHRDPYCLDCGVDTNAINENYMVVDDLWHGALPSEAGALCVGCIEKRLGRKLRRDDFAKFALTAFADGLPVSKRLRDRPRATLSRRRRRCRYSARATPIRTPDR